MVKQKFLRTIPFSKIFFWDVKRFYQSKISSSYPLVSLNKLIKQRIASVKLKDFPEKEFGILGISNKEGIFDAYTKKGKLIKRSYSKKVEINDLVYNLWALHLGAIGWRTEKQKNDFVSPAYVVFECLQGLSSEFLLRILKTNAFKKIINDNTTGSVRQTFKYDSLENLQIPLPPLKEQNRLVKNYNTKILLAEQQEQQVKLLKQEIEYYLFDVLGIDRWEVLEEKQMKINQTKRGLQFVHYKHFTDWNIRNIAKYNSNKFSLTSLNESLTLSVFRGKSPKYDKEGKSRILNQKCNRWNNLELEHSKKVNDKWYNTIDKTFFTQEGDILINSLGEGTIGRSTFITKQNEGLLYDSCIILLRLDQTKVDPKFFCYLLNSKYGQNQIEDIKSGRSTTQTHLGVTNLKNIMFPLPPMASQNEIANHISELSMQIQELNKQAKHNREKAIIEFENKIFCT